MERRGARGPAGTRSRGRRRAARASPATLVGLALWVLVRGHDGYDMAYALLWGDELWHGRLPELESAFAPTPHPLSNLLGLLVAPFGRPGGAEAFRLAIALSFGATGVAAFASGGGCSTASPPGCWRRC